MAKATAKLFMHGRSQAVRLPKEFRMPGTEVEIWHEGGNVSLRPSPQEKKINWSDFWAKMDSFGPTDDNLFDRDEGLQQPLDSGFEN